MSDSVWTRPHVTRPKTAWSVPISIFKDWIPETEEKLEEAFEFDFNMMKFGKMNDEEYADFKEELRLAYPIM